MGRNKTEEPKCTDCGVELTAENRKGRNMRCKPCYKVYQSNYNKQYWSENQKSSTPVIHLQQDKFILNAY